MVSFRRQQSLPEPPHLHYSIEGRFSQVTTEAQLYQILRTIESKHEKTLEKSSAFSFIYLFYRLFFMEKGTTIEWQYVYNKTWDFIFGTSSCLPEFVCERLKEVLDEIKPLMSR